jgi:hypothetical protein
MSRSEKCQKEIGSNQTEESRGVRLSVTALVALVGALLAAAISATSLTFVLVPGLKPDPKEKVGADLAVRTLDTNVNYGEYLDRPGKKIKEKNKPRDDYPGNVFYLRAHIEGFKRENVSLRWFTYNPTGERRPGSGKEATESTVFEPSAPTNTQVAQIWVREPGRFDHGVWDSDANTEPYFVRFELYSGDVLLAFEDSPKFYVG